MSQLIAEHSNAVGELKVLLHEAEVELKQKNGAEAKMEEEMGQMQAEIEGLKKELDGARKKAESVSKGDAELEGKLKDALKELAGVRDELEGTQEVSSRSRKTARTASGHELIKQVLEMNKSHFQLSLEELQGQHTTELNRAAEARMEEDMMREEKAQAEKVKMTEDMEGLRKGLKVS